MSLPEYDPDRYLEYQPNHRLVVLRRVAIFVPIGALFTWLLLVAIGNLPGSIIGVVILGICALAIDYEAVHALRDLAARPQETRGPVQRLWTKSRVLWMGRVNYLVVEKRLFEVSEITSRELRVGDEVAILHWPHTNVILTVERTAQGADRT